MFDVNAVMNGVGTRLATIAGLTVFDFIADNMSPPAAMVGLPDVAYDSTMARGSDDGTITVFVFVSRADAESARDELSAYMAGSGSKSIKAAIEADTTLNGSAHTARVVSATSDLITVGGVDYLAAEFTINVVA